MRLQATVSRSPQQPRGYPGKPTNTLQIDGLRDFLLPGDPRNPFLGGLIRLE